MPIYFPDSDSVLVAYSGGKDSLCVLDLAVQAGKRVEAFQMYFLPGLDYTEYWADLARQRWGIKIHQFLHWNTVEILRSGLFRDEPADIKKVSIKDVESQARRASGFEWIAYGYKSTDSLHRRGMMNKWVNGVCHTTETRGKICAPIKGWNDRDVKAYLTRRRIPIPSTDGTARNSGIGLSPFALEWLRAEWPDDYRRILKVFPYAVAQADRAPMLREKNNAEKQRRRQERAAARAAAD